MPTLITLVAAYGLCFGFQNKLPFLYKRGAFLDSLLECTYCLGFHCGWMTWILNCLLTGATPATWYSGVVSLVLWCFGSAAFCYAADTAVRWLEGNIPSQPESK